MPRGFFAAARHGVLPPALPASAWFHFRSHAKVPSFGALDDFYHIRLSFLSDLIDIHLIPLPERFRRTSIQSRLVAVGHLHSTIPFIKRVRLVPIVPF